MITTTRKEGELLDFQILHHSIDMAHVTLKQLPVSWSCLMMVMETMMIKRDGMMTHRVKQSTDYDDDGDGEDDNDYDGQGDAERQLVGANWFRGQGGAGQPPSEGRDWNVYFQAMTLLIMMRRIMK